MASTRKTEVTEQMITDLIRDYRGDCDRSSSKAWLPQGPPWRGPAPDCSVVTNFASGETVYTYYGVPVSFDVARAAHICESSIGLYTQADRDLLVRTATSLAMQGNPVAEKIGRRAVSRWEEACRLRSPRRFAKNYNHSLDAMSYMFQDEWM